MQLGYIIIGMSIFRVVSIVLIIVIFLIKLSMKEKKQLNYAEAELAYKEGDLDKALGFLDKAINENTETTEKFAKAKAYYLKGKIFEDKGDKPQAAENYKLATDSANHVDAFFNLAKILSEKASSKEEIANVIALYDKAQAIAPAREDIKAAKANIASKLG